MRTYLVLALGLFWTMPVNAQEWVAKYRDPAVPLGEAVQAHDAFLGTKAYERGKGHKVFEREGTTLFTRAPISFTTPLSTSGSSTSCWDLLSRNSKPTAMRTTSLARSESNHS